MQVHITFRHLNPSDHLKEYVETKTARFEKYLHEPIEVHAILQVEKIRHKAEFTVTAKNIRFHSEEESDDFHASIDLAVDKIERQLAKHKEKIKEH